MFELCDAELGISLGPFQSEAEAPGGSPETLRAIGRQSRATGADSGSALWSPPAMRWSTARSVALDSVHRTVLRIGRQLWLAGADDHQHQRVLVSIVALAAGDAGRHRDRVGRPCSWSDSLRWRVSCAWVCSQPCA